MKKPIIDHSWHSILKRDELSKACVKDKILELKKIAKAINKAEDQHTVDNLMEEGRILYALKKVQKYIDSPEGSDKEKEFYINYDYATEKAKKLERTIDKELSHLGL